MHKVALETVTGEHRCVQLQLSVLAEVLTKHFSRWLSSVTARKLMTIMGNIFSFPIQISETIEQAAESLADLLPNLGVLLHQGLILHHFFHAAKRAARVILIRI